MTVQPGIVGALKIVAQVLVFSRPCKGGDPWPSAQCDREHIFLDLKQQMIDAEWFIGALADRGDLGLKRRSVEGRSAEGAEASGVGYRRDQWRSRRRAHAA